MRYHGQMDDQTTGPLLTEREAAARIGWTPAGLRSHRERHDLTLLAERMAEELRDEIRLLADGRRWLAVVTSFDVEPWRLTTRDASGRQRLNARGLEVARALKFGRRPTEPPPYVRTEQGVRYPEADLLAWLDRHPAAQDRESMISERELAALLGIGAETIKTARYRARRAAQELAQIPRAKWPRHGESAAACRARLAQIAHLERVADSLPPGHKVGRAHRYRPEDVRAWQVRHPDPGPHPLEREPSRGRLLTPQEVATRLRIQPQSLVGYRYRAGAAARRLAQITDSRRKGETVEQYAERQREVVRLQALADCVPPHVVVDGVLRYQERDVREWERRRARAKRRAKRKAKRPKAAAKRRARRNC